MPLVFTNMYLPHVEHLCAEFGMHMLQFWQRRFRTYEKCPTVLAKNTTLFMNPEVPFESFKVLYKKENCTQYII